MVHLTSGLALVVEAGLAIFCFVDVLLAPEAAVRWLPRWGWALIMLIFPLCGVLGWLCAGRPWRARVRHADAPAAARTAEPAGMHLPDDVVRPMPTAASFVGGPRSVDVSLAEELLAVHEEHERTLRAWEADLRRREAELAAARTSSAPRASADS